MAVAVGILAFPKSSNAVMYRLILSGWVAKLVAAMQATPLASTLNF
jgi:hypothetical protein